MKKRWLVIVIILLVILILAGAGGYFYYSYVYEAPETVTDREFQEMIEAYAAHVNELKQDANEYDFTVLIEVPYGGSARGISTDTMDEAGVTLKVANYVKELNSDPRLRIVLTRDGDYNLQDSQEINICSLVNPDAIIDLRVSKNVNSAIMGVEAYYDDSFYDYRLTDECWAEAVERNVSTKCQTKALGVSLIDSKQEYSLIFDKSYAEVVFCMGYATNDMESSAMCSDTYLQNMALGILDAINEVRN